MRETPSRLTVCAATLLLALAPVLLFAQSDAAPEAPARTPMAYEELPSETPATFEPVTGEFDHIRREAMVPMRDGVELFLSLIHI